MLINPMTLTIFSKALNNYLQLDPQAKHQLQALQGRVLCISLTGTGKSLYFIFNETDITVDSTCDVPVDATIAATPLALVRLLARGNHVVLSDDITMEGKVWVAQAVQKLFSTLEIDWEEHLSTLTGDRFAYHASNALRGFKQWVDSAKENVTANMVEYCQEEADILVPPILVEQFCEDVDTVVMQVDRLLAKIDRLEKQQGGH